MRSIKTSFHAALVMGASLIGSSLLAYTVSQSMFVVDSSRSQVLDRIADEGMELVYLTHAVLQYPGPRSIGQWQSQLAELSELCAANDKAAEPDIAKILEQTRIRLDVLAPIKGKLLDARDRSAFDRQSSEVAAILSAQMFQEATQLQATMKALRAAVDVSLQAAYEQARIRQVGIFLFFATLGTLFGIYLSLGFRKRVLYPLNGLERTIDALRDGQRQRAPIIGNDEIGAISMAFNNLLDEQEEDEIKLRTSADEIMKLNSALEHRVQERTAQLEAANKDLEAFSYSVSHDLHAPLRAIDNFARILREDEAERLSPCGLQSLERIWTNAEKMGALIDDILHFSRVGRHEIRRADVDMTALAREVVDELRVEYPRAEATVAELANVSADASMLRQVWVNLIGNALKFSSKAETPRIVVGMAAAQEIPTFFVRDNGVGIDMAHAGKLFQVFERMHAYSDFPGTGAGLAIVKRIVERHGGRIWVESQPGMGATFYFTVGD